MKTLILLALITLTTACGSANEPFQLADEISDAWNDCNSGLSFRCDVARELSQ